MQYKGFTRVNDGEVSVEIQPSAMGGLFIMGRGRGLLAGDVISIHGVDPADAEALDRGKDLLLEKCVEIDPSSLGAFTLKTGWGSLDLGHNFTAIRDDIIVEVAPYVTDNS